MLSGLNVLVTRPNPAGASLCQAIDTAGGRAVYFPTIAIMPPQDTAAFQQQLAEINQQDWLIFISPQAVYASIDAIKAQAMFHAKVAAMGAGTADALRAANFPVDVYPKARWDSESLLDLPVFQHVAGQKIAIIRGEDGRDVLEAMLVARAAHVTSMVAYRRCLPQIEVSEIIHLLQAHQIDIMIVTSGTGLRNLKTLLHDAWVDLQEVPVVVISQRMVGLADDDGFRKILLADNASQNAIMTVLCQY